MSNATYKQDLHDIALAVATASKNYTDESIANLEWQIGTYNYDVATDSNVARIKTLPSDTYKSQIDYIGGKSVKYNQLVRNSNFESTSNWSNINSSFSVANNIATFTATAQNGNINQYIVSYVNNHKYLALARCKLTTATTAIRLFGNGGYLSVYSTATTDWQTLSKIFTGDSSEDRAFNIRDTRDSGWDAIQVKYLILIDLTDIFGSGNEPSDVATATTLLKANGYKLDGTDTYSTGELKHAVVSGVEYNSINVWDEEWEVGEIADATGQNVSSSSVIRSKNYISVMPNSILYFKTPQTMTVYQYDSNKNFLGQAYNFYGSNNTKTLESNCAYIRFKLVSAYGTTYNHDICINISNASYNGNYYPYVAPITKAIPSEVLADTRYGLGFDNTNYNHLDSDGHLRGSWGIVDFKDLDWKKQNEYKCFYTQVVGKKTGVVNVLCKYPTTNISMGVNTIMNYPDTIGQNSSNDYIYFYNASMENMTVSDFKTAMSGVYLVYELATAFDQDYSQYFTDNWNKVDLDKLYATAEMVCDEPIDMPNSITNLIKEVKA